MRTKIMLHRRYVDSKGETFLVTGLRPSRGRAYVKSESKPDDMPLSMAVSFLETALTLLPKEPKS